MALKIRLVGRRYDLVFWDRYQSSVLASSALLELDE